MNPFSSKALIAILSVGLLTFFLGLLLAAFSPDVFGRRSAGNDTFSYSLVGHRALAEFLRRSGLVVVVSRTAGLHRANRSFPLLLLEPEPAVERGSVDLFGRDSMPPLRDLDREAKLHKLAAAAFAEGAAVVLALPKWRVRPSAAAPDWIENRKLVELELAEGVLTAIASAVDLPVEEVEIQGSAAVVSRFELVRRSATTRVRAARLGLTEAELKLGAGVQLLKADPRIEPLVSCDEGIVIGRIADRLYVVSDPDLFNNSGLGRADHAPLVHALFVGQLKAEGVVVDETMHGYTSGRSLLGRVVRFPLVVISLHALLTLVLAAWALAPRFGKSSLPPPELPPGKRLLMDNTSRLLLAGGEHADALRRYLRSTLAELARRFSLSGSAGYASEAARRGDLQEREWIGRLASLSAARGISLDLEGLVRAARVEKLRASEALGLARRIHAWRRALLGTEAANTGAGRTKRSSSASKG